MIRSITDVYVASEKTFCFSLFEISDQEPSQSALGVGIAQRGPEADRWHAALRSARAAAGNKDIRLGGGMATIREYLKEGLVDEMHLAISPALLGAGEHLLSGLDLPKLGYRVTEHVHSAAATHIVLTKQQ